MQGSTPQSRTFFVVLWCLLSLPLVYVAFGGILVKQSFGCTVSGASSKVQAKAIHHLCSAWVTQQELQSDLLMAGTSAGFGVAQERVSC